MRALLLLAALAACRRPHGESDDETHGHTDTVDTDPTPARPRNVVLVITDDQRSDTMFAMPQTVERLGGTGVTFDRAYVTSPMCCPSRAATFSGGFYPHHNGVLSNDPPNGGAAAFVEGGSLPVRLQEAGYATALFGKYLNGYDELGPYVPAGWTRFAAQASGDYNAWEVVVGSSGVEAGEGEVQAGDTYLTDWLGAQALDFVDEHAGTDPFVLVVTPPAPHTPSQPAPQDVGTYADFTWRGGAYDEADVSDKPDPVRTVKPWTDDRKADMDVEVRDMLETLPAVDRLVVALLDRLVDLGIADDTLVVVTSDNGYLWGEHRQTGKGWPYEESVRVPLLARWPGGVVGSSDLLVAGDLDIPATVAEFTGLATAGDGRTLGPILRGEPTDDWRDRLLLMNYTPGNSVWAGVVTRDLKVVVNRENEREIYDLAADPYELDNLDVEPAGADELWTWLGENRGLLLKTQRAAFEPDVPQTVLLDVVGGTPPYHFELFSGTLPAGIDLDASTGRLGGKTSETGEFGARIVVTDSSVSAYHGGHQRYVGAVTLQVGAPEPMMLAPTETTSSGDRSAVVRLHPRRSGTLVLETSLDPTFDNARRLEVRLEAGPATVPLGDLLPGRRYYARGTLDGVPLDDWSWVQR